MIEAEIEEQLYNLFFAKPSYLVDETSQLRNGDSNIIIKNNTINTQITTTTKSSNYHHSSQYIEKQIQVNKKIKLSLETKVMNIVTGVTNNNLISIKIYININIL